MKKIHNLVEYKKSTIIIKDLSYLIEELTDLEIKLIKYVNYSRIREILRVVDETKRDFKMHINNNKNKLKESSSG